MQGLTGVVPAGTDLSAPGLLYTSYAPVGQGPGLGFNGGRMGEPISRSQSMAEVYPTKERIVKSPAVGTKSEVFADCAHQRADGSQA